MITHDLRLIADAIIDKKGQDVVSLDLRKMDGAITDFFVVCDGSNTTQVGAIAANVAEKMQAEGHTLWRSQGEGNNFWIIQDYGNIVVHIFLKEYREEKGNPGASERNPFKCGVQESVRVRDDR